MEWFAAGITAWPQGLAGVWVGSGTCRRHERDILYYGHRHRQPGRSEVSQHAPYLSLEQKEVPYISSRAPQKSLEKRGRTGARAPQVRPLSAQKASDLSVPGSTQQPYCQAHVCVFIKTIASQSPCVCGLELPFEINHIDMGAQSRQGLSRTASGSDRNGRQCHGIRLFPGSCGQQGWISEVFFR